MMGPNRSVRIVAVLASSVLFLPLLVPSAEAALCVRLAVNPANPSVGPAQLELRTFVPVVESEGTMQLRPEPVPSYPFQVVAVDPLGKRMPIAVRPSDNDPQLWIGPVAFADEGTWEIHVTNFEPEGGVVGTVDRTCYARLRVLVLGQGATSTPPNVPATAPRQAHWVVFAASLSAIALGGVAFLAFRRRFG